jgi:hypothetical protein
MTKTKVFSLHAIWHHPNGGDQPQVKTPPGVVFALHDQDVARMKKLGAVRDPTADELQLYALANGATLVEAKSEETADAPPAPVKGGKKAASDSLLG